MAVRKKKTEPAPERAGKTKKVLVRLTPELHARALKAVAKARELWADDGAADATLAGTIRENLIEFCRRVESAAAASERTGS
jgi:hypothetical protein